MGHNTDVQGVLKFKNKISIEELQELNKFMGEHPHEHSEWLDGERTTGKYSYLQWEILQDYSGIKYDGNEKFYYIVEGLNLILRNMQKKFPDFAFEGELLCQGDEIDDRWKIVIEDGIFKRYDIELTGKIITCPHCDEKFLAEEAA